MAITHFSMLDFFLVEKLQHPNTFGSHVLLHLELLVICVALSFFMLIIYSVIHCCVLDLALHFASKSNSGNVIALLVKMAQFGCSVAQQETLSFTK